MISDIAEMRFVRVVAAPLASLLLATACQPAAQSSPATGKAGSARASASPSLGPASNHVFVIVLENTSYRMALRQPYIASLATQYAVATNYGEVTNPSLPNYLAMTSGSTWGIRDDNFHQLPATGLGNQLSDAGISWKAYMEGFTGDCFSSPYPYALKHNPFAYYGGACPTNVVPIEGLDSDLAGATPNFVWITPGLCHDGHDCAVDVAGAWLDGLVSRIASSDAWRSGGTLFIVWDEGNGGDTNLVPLIVLTEDATATRVDSPYDHYSLLATIEDLFGLPRLGSAATATPLARPIDGGH